MIKQELNIRLKSPLVHTEEVKSNISSLFTEKRKVGNNIFQIPAIKGNSIRGIIRDLIFEHLFKELKLDEESVAVDTFYILFSGGFLEGMESAIDINAKRGLRKMLPALSILGSAVGKEMLMGKLIVSSAYPRCKELETGEMSIYDQTQVIRHTRVDDRKLKYGKEKDERKAQMFYDIEVLNAGTELDLHIILDSENEIEKACLNRMIKQLAEKPYFGGKSSAGYGEFEFINIDIDKLDSSAYDNYIKENSEKIKEFILNYSV